MGGPMFSNCTFNGSIPLLPEAQFEECIFNITNIKQLPGVCQCNNCMVEMDGDLYMYGRSLI